MSIIIGVIPQIWAQQVKCYNSSDYSFNHSGKGLYSIISSINSVKNFSAEYRIVFPDLNDSLQNTFSMYSYEFSSNTRSYLKIRDFEVCLDTVTYANTKYKCALISLWDEDSPICNVKEQIIAKDTFLIIKGTNPFCNGKSCRSYTLLLFNSRTRRIMALSYSGTIRFESVQLMKREGHIVIQVEEKQRKKRFYPVD